MLFVLSCHVSDNLLNLSTVTEEKEKFSYIFFLFAFYYHYYKAMTRNPLNETVPKSSGGCKKKSANEQQGDNN